MFFFNLVIRLLLPLHVISTSEVTADKFARTESEKLAGVFFWSSNITASVIAICVPSFGPLWAVGTWGVCCSLTCIGCQFNRYESFANNLCDIQKSEPVNITGLNRTKRIRAHRKYDNCLVTGCFIVACPILFGKEICSDRVSENRPAQLCGDRVSEDRSPVHQVMTDPSLESKKSF